MPSRGDLCSRCQNGTYVYRFNTTAAWVWGITIGATVLSGFTLLPITGPLSIVLFYSFRNKGEVLKCDRCGHTQW